MKYPITISLTVGLLGFSAVALGHGTEDHSESNRVVEQPPAASPAAADSSVNQLEEIILPSTDNRSKKLHGAATKIEKQQSATEQSAMPVKPNIAFRLGNAFDDFAFEDFPTLHPIVVHVPVIMIPIACLFGIISIFFDNRNIVVLATAFALAGLLGGYVAAFPMHPHTRGLPEAAIRTLQQHDFFAYSTLAITAFAVAVGVIALLKPNYFVKGLLALILVLASLCVSVTAHYGGTLTYVHGIGVKGNYLDTH